MDAAQDLLDPVRCPRNRGRYGFAIVVGHCGNDSHWHGELVGGLSQRLVLEAPTVGWGNLPQLENWHQVSWWPAELIRISHIPPQRVALMRREDVPTFQKVL